MNLWPSALAAIVLCLSPKALPAAEPTTTETAGKQAFFAFDNGTGRGRLAPDVQAKMLAELGYDGIGYTGTQNIPAMLEALDRHKLKMFNTYVGAKIGPDGPSYDPHLKEAVAALKGRQTTLWLYITGNAPDGEKQAVQVVREVADLAAESKLRVVLYPHVGFYVAQTEDALRVVEKVDRPNVGVSLNLCHWLKLDDERNMEQLIKKAMPHLELVSINGADRGDTNAMGWDRLIQTLDRGTFDVGRFLAVLKKHGYTGPVGLQCYAVKGDTRENLKRSIDAWRKMTP